jgi:hypothetical protein
MTTNTDPDPLIDAREIVAPSDSMVPFSLFDRDWLNRIYASVGLSSRDRLSIFKRSLSVLVLTWLPVAALALQSGYIGGGMTATNFFADFAAYAQFLVGMPLFIVAEPIIDASTKDVAFQLVSCGIVRPADRSRLCEIHRVIATLRQSYWPDLICVLVAYALSLVILVPEFGPNPALTWHVKNYASWRMLTTPGLWEFLVALPILNYTWLRFVWKILVWIFYLARVARMRLDLHPTHPDLTGGIGFISEAQGRFAIFILAYGISNVAATVGYEIVILHYNVETMPVWGPLLGFAIGAPLLFTLPLLMFTKKLYIAKRHALAVYRERVTGRSRSLESRWLKGDQELQSTSEEIRELSELTTLSTMFVHIEKMRVVPFDLRSMGQLMGSSFGSVATILPLLHFNGQVTNIFEALGKLLGHL